MARNKLGRIWRDFGIRRREWKEHILYFTVLELFAFPVILDLSKHWVEHAAHGDANLEWWLKLGIVVALQLFLIISFALVVVYATPLEARGCERYVDSLEKLISKDRGPHVAKLAKLVRLKSLLGSLLRENSVCEFPVIDCVDIAYEILRHRSECLASGGKILLRARHVVPTQRSEGYWWNAGLAQDYLNLQKELIRVDKLEVRRLIIYPGKNDIADQDGYSWMAQSAAGIKLKLLTVEKIDLGNQFTASQPADFAVIDTLLPSMNSSDALVTRDVVVEYKPDSKQVGRIDFLPSDGGVFDQQAIYVQKFDAAWKQQNARPLNEDLMPSPSNPKPSEGHTVFFARSYIRSATEFIKAVDVSDLKNGLHDIFDDPVYLSWYELTYQPTRDPNWIGDLERVYILRRTKASVKEFKDNHLIRYFDENGLPIDKCHVSVIFHDTLTKEIEHRGQIQLHRWLEQHPHICNHLKEINEWRDDDYTMTKLIVSRDFLITESMIYDYRQDKGNKDFDDKLLIIPATHNRNEIIREWRDIIVYLKELGHPGPNYNGLELIEYLDRQVIDQQS